MSYLVDYCDDQEYIHVVVSGELTLAVLQQIAQSVAQLANEKKCYRILNDLREATLTPKAFEVVGMPLSAQNSGVKPKFSRALIVGNRQEDFKFLETVFINQGHIVKMFSTFEEGQAWLYQ